MQVDTSPHTFSDEEEDGSFASPLASAPVKRFFGRVTHYDGRSKAKYGFIQELGSWSIHADGSRVFNPSTVKDRIYFHASKLRYQVGDAKTCLVAFCTNDIVEFQMGVYTAPDTTTSYRAFDITGLLESRLPFHKGIVAFVPYAVAIRRAKVQATARGQSHFISILKRGVKEDGNDEEGGGGGKETYAT